MKNVKIGIQLCTVGDKMKDDMKGTLKELKEMGYDCVEFAGFFDKSAGEIRSMLDELGLEGVSVHQDPAFYDGENRQEVVDFVKALGAKYAAIPWYSTDEYIKDSDKAIDFISRIGKFLADNGIQLVYHNHEPEFRIVGDETIIDQILGRVDAKYLQPEFDTCWVKYAGYDPVELLKKYSGRVDVVHLKDFTCENLGIVYPKGQYEPVQTRDDKKLRFKPVGHGLQDMKAICDTAVENGAKYLIVEQDNCYGEDTLEVARVSREYLKTIGY